MILHLPYQEGFFRGIEVDPAWQYDQHGYKGYEGVQEYRIAPSYTTAEDGPMGEVLGREILRVGHPEGFHLWMWTTKDFLHTALSYIKDWGLHYRMCYPWLKTTMKGVPIKGGMGYWGRNSVEYLLFATSNLSMRTLNATSEPGYILAPRQHNWMGRLHSVKPDRAYELIRRNSPGPRLSLLQVTPRHGFYNYGNQLPYWYRGILEKEFTGVCVEAALPRWFLEGAFTNYTRQENGLFVNSPPSHLEERIRKLQVA